MARHVVAPDAIKFKAVTGVIWRYAERQRSIIPIAGLNRNNFARFPVMR